MTGSVTIISNLITSCLCLGKSWTGRNFSNIKRIDRMGSSHIVWVFHGSFFKSRKKISWKLGQLNLIFRISIDIKQLVEMNYFQKYLWWKWQLFSSNLSRIYCFNLVASHFVFNVFAIGADFKLSKVKSWICTGKRTFPLSGLISPPF